MTAAEDNTGEENDEPEVSPEKRRTKKYARRAGYIVFIGGGFAIFVMSLVGVVRGIRNDRAWNPYTGLRQQEGACLERARRLVEDSTDRRAPTPEWVGRYRDWQVRCKEGHPELYELLEATRRRLQADESAEKPASGDEHRSQRGG